MALHQAVLDEILEVRVRSSRGRQNPRGVKRKMSNFPIRRPTRKKAPQVAIEYVIVAVK
jgi:hypothetical protein